jgi:hypothetical protein
VGVAVKRFVVVASLVLSTVAAADQKPLRIALYAPNAPFASGIDRANFASRLAQQISSVAGVPARADAYARAADLEKAIASKQVDFAVLDGVYLAETGKYNSYSCLATATVGGETSPKWSLFASSAEKVKDLQNKKLSAASTAGRDDDFVSNGLFDGEISARSKFFAGTTKAPDLASAVQAVTLGKAEAVFAPESMGKGMKSIFDAGRVPNAGFCQVTSGLPGDLVGKVKQAVLSHGAAAALDGWKAADVGAYRALAGRLSAKSKRPFMAEPNAVKLEDLDVLVPPSVEASQPELKTQFWYP